VWEHRLTDPLPARIPHADGSLDEVHLEGSFNARLEPARLVELLTEAGRVLKPGGSVAVHGLVSDRPFPGVPNLPGMAALVQRVPVETEPLEALQRVGFVGLTYEKLGDIHCFQVGGVELRELRLVGRKPGGSATGSCGVLYKGPLAEVTDEDGTVFRRGERVEIPAGTAERLRQGPAGEQFAFLPR
jgi:hypothetical protein